MVAISDSGGLSALRLFDRADTHVERSRAAYAVGSPLPSLPSGTRSQSSLSPVSLSIEQGQGLIAKAGVVGSAALDTLAQLRALALVALDTSLVGTVPHLSGGGLTTDARRLVDGLNAAVANATQAGANLVLGGSRDVRINTSAQGGVIVAAVQALDGNSLNLAGLDLSTRAGAEDALARISVATSEAQIRTERINALSRALGSQGEFLDALKTVAAELVLSGAGLRGYGAGGTRTSSGGSARGAVLNILV